MKRTELDPSREQAHRAPSAKAPLAAEDALGGGVRSTAAEPDAPGATMQAVVQHEYGSPDVLSLEDVPPPPLEGDSVRVRVRAAALNQGDWHLMSGLPYLVRFLGFGLRRPKQVIPGQYVAGTVEAVGASVTTLRPGDDVYGSCKGAFAQLAMADEDALAPMPKNLTFEQAAAVPHGGFTALQALRDAGRLRPGQHVLVLGASGAVGTLAVQIAKTLGAEVTGVCSRAKLERVHALGADHVLDYQSDDFAAAGERYDLILDMAHDRPQSDYRRALVPGGRAVMVSGGKGKWLGGMHRVVGGALTSLFYNKKLVPFMALPKKADLEALTELIEGGGVTPHVDRSFPLTATAEAFRHLEGRTAFGMIVVTP